MQRKNHKPSSLKKLNSAKLFLRRDINNQTSKSYKFYLFILRGILKTKIECVFFFEFIPKKFLIRVFFAHSVLCYTYILPKQRAVHKNFVLFFLNGLHFTLFKNVHAVYLVHTWSTACLAIRKVFFAFAFLNLMVILGAKIFVLIFMNILYVPQI